MAIWNRKPAVARQLGLPWFGTGGPMVPVQDSGFADVDMSRLDTSLQSVAVRSSVDLIASLASELPVHVYRGEGPSRERLPLPPWLRDPDGTGYGLADWCYRVLMSWLLRGNLFAEELDRATAGFRRQVEIFHPDMVSGWMADGQPQWSVNGRQIDGGRFVHKRVNPVPGVILGASPIAYHASQIGVSLAALGFGRQWFTDGAHPSAILNSTERDVTEKLAQTVKKRFMAALRGSREPVVLDKGWEYHQVQVAPGESQFLETMGYSEAQCARIFGPGIAEVLGYAVKGASLTYSNIADRDLHLLKYSLNRWLRRLERLLSEFLPAPQYVRLDRDALLETNTMQRYNAHSSALSNRWKTVNEVRADEDLGPVEWGDQPNMTYTGMSVTPEQVDPGSLGLEPADDSVVDEEDEDT